MADRYIAKGTTTLSTVTNGDSAIFGEGEQTVDGGTDLSGLSTLVDIIVKRAFTGRIVDLTFDNSGVVWYDAGGGSMSIVANGTLTEIIAKVWHTGLGVLTAKTAGTITEWQQNNGTGYIQDTIIVTNIRLSGGTLNQKYKTDANTAVIVAGGQFNTGRPVTTLTATGGVTVVRREDSSATVPTATTVTVDGPAVVRWAGGNITTLNLNHPKAVFDWSDAPAALTITNLNGFAEAIYKAGLPTAGGGTAVNKTNRTLTLTNAATQYVGKSENYAAMGGAPV